MQDANPRYQRWRCRTVSQSLIWLEPMVTTLLLYGGPQRIPFTIEASTVKISR